MIHTDVWMRGPLTGFYIREQLRGAVPSIRMTYIFGDEGLQGGGSCPVEKNWRECIESLAGTEHANDVVSICASDIDMRAIPAWMPSRNDQKKQQLASELRLEIEARWRGVKEIVIRDFNLEDNQITMYLKMPDGDFYTGCGLHAARTPHCEAWHLFGQASLTNLRKWIFARPYRLK
jgi:hypothetical protein